MNKRAMEMSWSFIGWLILAMIVLFVIVLIIKNGSAPGFNSLDILADR